MLNLSQEELKLIAQDRGIKGCKSMSKHKLLSIFKAPEPIKKQNYYRHKKKVLIMRKYLDIKPLFEPEPIKKIKLSKT